MAATARVPPLASASALLSAASSARFALVSSAARRASAATAKAIFGLPEVKIGLFPAQVLSVLDKLLPRRVLAEMCITGEPITAAQALEYGLVNHVREDLDEGVDWLLGRILDKSPSAIRRGLYTMTAIEQMAFEESMSFTESQIALFALTEDAQEGQLAFREKRKPQWTGK